jgi:hypothetical protein
MDQDTPPAGPATFVYFIRGGEHIKIGWSKDPLKRLEQLRTGCPYPLEMLGCMAGEESDERALHEHFAHLRERGEWFKAEPWLLAHIRWLCSREDKRSSEHRALVCARERQVSDLLYLAGAAIWKLADGQVGHATEAFEVLKSQLRAVRPEKADAE